MNRTASKKIRGACRLYWETMTYNTVKHKKKSRWVKMFEYLMKGIKRIFGIHTEEEKAKFVKTYRNFHHFYNTMKRRWLRLPYKKRSIVELFDI